MDHQGSECSVLESVEDNDSITNASEYDNLVHLRNNGIHVEESDGNHEFPKQQGKETEGSGSGSENLLPIEIKHEIDGNHEFPKKQGNGTEASGSENSPQIGIKPELSTPSPTITGKRLKKWKRIKRDVNKIGNTKLDAETMETTRGLSPRGSSSSKRLQVSDRKQKSEGSVSSTKAMARNFDGFAPLGDSGFAAGTDSENSEDRSSKSSTAASGPKTIKNRIKNLSGNALTHSSGSQRKNPVENNSKAIRGESVKIEKENSQSSIESDSRSSNFVFVQGIYPTSNGVRSKKLSEQQVSDDVSQNDGVADSSWKGKEEEESENHGSSTEADPLVESVFALQSVQEALEKELLRFREINKDFSSDDSFEDSTTDLDSSDDSELLDLFKRTLEAEIENLALAKSVQDLSVLENQKALASEQTEILHNLEDNVNRAEVLKKEAENLKEVRGEIASVDEALKLQNRVCKYSSCFFLQLVLLMVVLGVFMVQLSPNYEEFVPT